MDIRKLVTQLFGLSIFIGIASIFRGFLIGTIPVEHLVIYPPFIIQIIVVSYLILIGKSKLALFFFCALLMSVSLFSFYMWGILHYLGIVLFVLDIVFLFFSLPIEKAVIISAIGISIFFIIGILQAFNLLSYEADWSPKVNIFDHIMLVSLFTIILLIAWKYSKSASIQLKRIKKLNLRLEKTNSNLEHEVVKKTKEIMRKSLLLGKAELEMTKTYESLEDSEKEKIDRINQLSHVTISIANNLHNMKNPLMSLMNCNSQNTDPEWIKNIKEIDKTIDNINEEINVFDQKSTFVLNDVIKASELSLKWKIKKNKILIKNSFSNKIVLTGYKSKIKQILINLIDNAIDASSEMKNPKIWIRLESIKGGNECMLKISDNGVGVKKKNEQDIFNPFTSTKKIGYGMGLYIVKKYLTDYFDGSVNYSRKNSHTVFRINLPLKNQS